MHALLEFIAKHLDASDEHKHELFRHLSSLVDETNRKIAMKQHHSESQEANGMLLDPMHLGGDTYA